jgi:hypothetical protein
VEFQAGNFWSWVAADPSLPDYLSAPPAGTAPDLKATEARWSEMGEDDPVLREILGNPGSTSLLRFAATHKPVAEVLVADVTGRLVAASRKTTDYDQSDEAWWVVGKSLPESGMWADALHFDLSAGVFSLDLVLPIHRRGELRRWQSWCSM